MSLFDKDLIEKELNFDPDSFNCGVTFKGTIYSYQTNVSAMRRIKSHLYINQYGHIWYVVDVD